MLFLPIVWVPSSKASNCTLIKGLPVPTLTVSFFGWKFSTCNLIQGEDCIRGRLPQWAVVLVMLTHLMQLIQLQSEPSPSLVLSHPMPIIKNKDSLGHQNASSPFLPFPESMRTLEPPHHPTTYNHNSSLPSVTDSITTQRPPSSPTATRTWHWLF